MISEFTPQILEAIIQHMADPLDQRTLKELADDLQISVSTISKYKNQQRAYIAEQVEKRRKEFIPALRQAAYKALGARLMKSDNSLKLAFQLLGDLVERTETNVNYRTVEEKKNEIKAKLSKLGLSLVSLDGSIKHNIDNLSNNIPVESVDKSNQIQSNSDFPNGNQTIQ